MPMDTTIDMTIDMQDVRVYDGLVHRRLTEADLIAARDAILGWRALAPKGIGGVNVGGWKSEYGALDREELVPIRDTIKTVLFHKVKLESWAMVNANGSKHPRHIHYGSLGGVFYITSGDPMAPLIVEVRGAEIEIDPIPGRLVVWRRPVWHRVDTYVGTEPRISIAFEAEGRS